jgi:hypothetical protein
MNTVLEEYIREILASSINISSPKSSAYPKDAEDLLCKATDETLVKHNELVRYATDIFKLEQWLSTINRKEITEEQIKKLIISENIKNKDLKITNQGRTKYLTRLYQLNDINYILPDTSKFQERASDAKDDTTSFEYTIPSTVKNTKKTINNKGMINTTGNHCWLSSGLQMMLSIPEFKTIFSTLNESDVTTIDLSNASQINTDKTRLVEISNFLREFNSPDLVIVDEKKNFLQRQLNLIKKEYFLRPLIKYTHEMLDITKPNKFNITMPYEGTTLRQRFFEIFATDGTREDDATQIIQKIIELFEYNNKNIYGLFNIFKTNLKTTKYCKYGDITTTQSAIYVPIDLDITYNSVQEHFDNFYKRTKHFKDPNIPSPIIDCAWTSCLNNNDARPHDIHYEIELFPDTRYLFIRPINIAYKINEDTGVFGFERKRESTEINPQILVNGIKFNVESISICKF